MINQEKSLAAFLPFLQAAPWIALDTEADSLHAYPEKICLLQISLPDRDDIIDPLAGLDLNPLLAILASRELILHGADYDLRLLWRGFRFVPSAIFDTMCAARLLGHTEFGLTHLVMKHLGVQLEKGPQKMNWARRPLTARMEMYARNDTRYLRPLAEILRGQLEEKGRLPWLQETCARLLRDCSEDRVPDPDGVWRIKGSDRMDGAALGVLRELWHWREREALRKNRPPYFVLSHELLVAIAAASASGQDVGGMVPRHFSPGRKGRLLDAVAHGLNVSPADRPKVRRTVGHRLNRKQQAQFEEMRVRRDQRGEELGIDPTLIASRATLVALASDPLPEEIELMRWQREVLAV